MNSSATGDFNSDCAIDQIDIDLLRLAVINMTSDPDFNVDGIGVFNIPDAADFDHMITVILATGFGDGDLNQIVNFADFVQLSNNFNLSQTGWLEGNYNLDENTNFEDFVLMSNNFNMVFSSGSNESAVPEPVSGILWSLILMFSTIRQSAGRKIDVQA